MSAPAPIPSKAALRALRGLVLGTSCTIGLIAEDRRRRINAARSAIHNADRIRSTRRYSVVGSAAVAALERESQTVEPGTIRWTQRSRGTDSEPHTRARKPVMTSMAQTRPRSNARPPRDGPASARRYTHSRHPGPGRDRDWDPDRDRQSPSPPSSSSSWRTGRLMRHGEASVASTASSLSFLSSTIRGVPVVPPSTSTAAAASASYISPAVTAEAPLAAERIRLSGLLRRIRSDSTGTTSKVPTLCAHRDRDAGRVTTTAQRLRQVIMEVHGKELTTQMAILDMADGDTPPQTLFAVTAALCRDCQAAGRMDLAQTVLRLAVDLAPMDEATYFAHDPLPVVLALTPLADVAAMEGNTVTDEQRQSFYHRLRDAAYLFLPPSVVWAPPPRTTPAVGALADTARGLLACALVLRRGGRRRALAQRVFAAVAGFPGDLTALLHWFVVAACRGRRGDGDGDDDNNDDLVLWAFLLRPPTDPSQVADGAFFALGDHVVDAVRLARAPNAVVGVVPEVLQRLLALCGVGRRLKTQWVADLLYTVWTWTGEYTQVQPLFAMVAGDGNGNGTHRDVGAHVFYANGVYRTMVQIALEADRGTDAQRYYDELVAQEPAAAGDIRLRGLFALAKAKHGDWAAVRQDFAAAFAASGTRTAAGAPLLPGADRVFVPIAREYLQTHTIGEAEAFLRAYLAEVGVPVCKELVTLVAHRYGALGEVASFLGWLTFCAGAGFAVDAAFSNAILASCHQHWRFCYEDLRQMHARLCRLSPAFEDDVTRRIMVHAALANANTSKTRLHGGKDGGLSRRVPGEGAVPTHTAMGRPAAADEHVLYTEMKQAYHDGQLGRATRIYQQAVADGRLQPGGKCLQLAVAALVRQQSPRQKKKRAAQLHGRRPPPPLPPAFLFDTAIGLLRDAHDAGANIDAATTYIALAYVDALCPRAALTTPMPAARRRSTVVAARAKAVRVADTVKEVLGRLAACGVPMSDLALNRAAFHLFRAGHLRGAVAMAHAAAEAATGSADAPGGYNLWNFCVLLSAYARLADAEGLRRVMVGAAAVPTVLGQRMALQVLKQARRELRKEVAAARAVAAGGVPGHGESTTIPTRPSEPGPVPLPEAEAALAAVEAALMQAKAARERLGQDRAELKTGAVAIMRRAAWEAEDGGRMLAAAAA